MFFIDEKHSAVLCVYEAYSEGYKYGVSIAQEDIVMIELIAFAYLAELKHNERNPRSAAAEDAFYRDFRPSPLWLLAESLRSLLRHAKTEKGRDMRDPPMFNLVKAPLRQRCAAVPDLRRETHRCGTAGSAS